MPKIIREIVNNRIDSCKPKRVAIYARISTANSVQIHSLGSQLLGLIDSISDTDMYKLVDVYVDIGSGAKITNRKNFNRLINDCNKGLIDIVLVKSVSRFSRNVVDALSSIRKLKDKKVGIYFVNEKINTLNMEGELLLSIISAFQQSESESKSDNMKLSIRRSLRGAESKLLNRKCYGYINDADGSLEIIESEAENVKKIFDLYLKGYSILKLQKYLFDNHIKSPRGNSKWSKRAIETLLANEKYVGDVKYYKSYLASYPLKKRKYNGGEKDMIECTKHHEPIIKRDVFNKVQKEKMERSNVERVDGYVVARKKTRYNSNNQ